MRSLVITRDLDFTDPLKFPETAHHGLVIIRIRETLSPSFVNQVLTDTIRVFQSDEFESAIVIVEESRFRRRLL